MPKQDYYEKGQLTDLAYLVLASLTEPRHGYTIMQSIEDLSNGEFSIGPGSLYTTLKKLTHSGYINLISDTDNKKIYHVTKKGLEEIKASVEKRKRLALYGEQALKQYKEGINDEV